jgi:hypothetical protein
MDKESGQSTPDTTFDRTYLTLQCKPELPQSPSDLIPNPIVYLTLYPQIRSNVSRCPRENMSGIRP